MEPALQQIIESIIFVSDQPVKATFLRQVLAASSKKNEAAEESGEETDESSGPSLKEVQAALEGLKEKYQDIRYPFEVKEISGGYQFYTKRAFYPFVKKAVVNKNKRRLTRSALETLSIIAYRQPITKAEVEFIRGVNCDYSIQKLLEKNLVSIVGRADAPGRPLLYSTSPFFMEYFGISDMGEMPKLKEFTELEEDQLDQFRLNKQENHEETTEGEESGVLAEGDRRGEDSEETPAQSVEEAVAGDEGEASQSE